MDRLERMLKEYELCEGTVGRIESTIWKTGAAIGIGSLGPLVLFTTQKEKPDWETTFIIGILIFFASLIWWFMARRWWDIQHTTFLRMRHIEEELQFYAIRYIYHKDRKLELSPNGADLRKEHIEQLNKIGDTRFHLRGVQQWLRLFPYFSLISWIEYGIHRWNESTPFYRIQCLRQSIVYIIILLLPFLILIIGNTIYIRIKVGNMRK